MEKRVQLVLVLLVAFASIVAAQIQTIPYAQSIVLNVPNPERGFYYHTETYTSSYDNLSDEMPDIPAGLTLILRNYYLDSFVAKELSSDFLQKVSTEFALARQKGFKMIPRFSYSSELSTSVKDAKPELVLRHIQQLSKLLTDNADVILLLQAGFVGVWGEWYYSTYFPANSPYRASVITALFDTMPASRQIALRTIAYKQTYLNSPGAVSSASEASDTSKKAARIGLYDDCFLLDDSDAGTYRGEADKTYSATEASVGLAYGGESCGTSKLTSCPSALGLLKTRHMTYLNIGYHEKVIANWRSGGCFNEVRDRLGYRLVAQLGRFSAQASPGGIMNFELYVKNDGFAPPVNPRDVEVILQGTTRRCVARLPGINPKAWAADSVFLLSANLALPQDMPLGAYRVLLNLPDPTTSLRGRKEYSMVLVNTDVSITADRMNDLKHTLQLVRAQSGSVPQGSATVYCL